MAQDGREHDFLPDYSWELHHLMTGPLPGTAEVRNPVPVTGPVHTPASLPGSFTLESEDEELLHYVPLGTDGWSPVSRSPVSFVENPQRASSPILVPGKVAQEEAAPAASPDEAAPASDAAEDALLAGYRAARTLAQRRWRARRDLTAKDRVLDAMLDIMTAATSSLDAQCAVANVLACATSFIESVTDAPLGARMRAMESHFGLPPPGAKLPAERVGNIVGAVTHGPPPFECTMLAGLAWAEAAARDQPAVEAILAQV
jgi:hypothetical protein